MFAFDESKSLLQRYEKTLNRKQNYYGIIVECSPYLHQPAAEGCRSATGFMPIAQQVYASCATDLYQFCSKFVPATQQVYGSFAAGLCQTILCFSGKRT